MIKFMKDSIIKNLPDKIFFHILLIALLGLAAYSNTFNSSFHFDDEPNIIDNPAIKNLTELLETQVVSLNNRFIGYLTFYLNYRLNGLDVTGYHIFNMAIHIINAGLVYLLVLLTFNALCLSDKTTLIDNAGRRNSIALFSALFFVSHPVQTQAVTYIVQRFTSLATMFYLLSLVMYIRFRSQQSAISGQQKLPAPRYRLYAVSLFSAILAIKTKEISFTLPIMMAIYEFMFFTGKIRKKILYLMPFFIVMFLVLLSLAWIDKPFEELTADLETKTRTETDMSRRDYQLTQLRVIVSYIRLIFFPINQNFDYDYPIYNSFFNSDVLLSFIFLLSLFGFAAYLFYSTRHTLHPARLISFGISWFFIALAVESSIIPIVDVINEHRLYLPSVGGFIAITASVFSIADKLKNSGPMIIEKAIIPVLFLTIIGLTSATYARNMVWQDELSLWSDVVKESPNKARGYYNLGTTYQDKRQFDMAIENYTKAVSINPAHIKAYINRGNAYDEKKQPYKAIEDYLKALSINPDYADAYFNLGVTCFRNGMIDNAISNFRKACFRGNQKSCESLKQLSESR
ncbi:MAG: tetratricopeptide repeat protein [Nitrospirae bacterium]|nr:MAG: tetratricopeptide repeat protein [Nitrospirota bacterium]